MTATRLPPLRPELVLDRGVLKDPRTGDFYNLGDHESFLLAGLDGRRSAAELAGSFEAEFGEPLPADDLDEFLDLARGHDLLAPPPADDEAADLGAEPVRTAADTATLAAGDTQVLPAAPTADPTKPLPARRADLVVRQTKDDGSHVVKDPLTGQFYDLGPEESFLLLALDGTHTAATLAAAFEARFGSPLAPADVDDFLAIARGNGFVYADAAPADAAPAPAPRKPRQSILYLRKTVFDPDRLFTWLEPKLRFVWTTPFLIGTAVLIVLAACAVWSGRAALVGQLPHVMRWDVLALAWLTLVTVTTLHEFAHGLTCKHYGGEVHEVGFLLVFFTPCFFCNVSDAWLFKERSKRLWVTFAGGYCDLVMWAVAVFAWRVAQPGTLPSHLAWVVLTVCGGRIFFNFNPLMKLDGYYLLGDAVGLANLQQRGREALFARARWLLWGAPRPAAEAWGRFVLAYGIAAYAYSLFILSVMIVALARYAHGRWGLIGVVGPAFLAWLLTRTLLSGLFAGEVRRMFASRPKRLVAWALALAGLAAAASFVEIERQAEGPFLARPVTRAEVFAPVAGFLREVPLDEGDRVSPGGLVARLEVPDLNNRLAQKRNEVTELTVKAGHCRAELDAAKDDFVRIERLAKSSATSQDEYRQVQRRVEACTAELEETRAKLASAKEEVQYLEGQAAKLAVYSPVPGLIMTPRLREKVGQFLREGELICVVEDPAVLRAEVKLPEQEVERVRPGQRVELKARALPFEVFVGTVERVAPAAAAEAGPTGAAASASAQSTVTVYCQFEADHPDLRPGMTGHARVQCGRLPAGRVLGERMLRFIRTEFWW
ncbi:MAG TPA: efflux RND transporter periplasmic adaptor subunit [Gemmataceae bacterium]|jgi:RND family efflux transporter MFP subunit